MISTHPTYVVNKVIFGAINDYASNFGTVAGDLGMVEIKKKTIDIS